MKKPTPTQAPAADALLYGITPVAKSILPPTPPGYEVVGRVTYTNQLPPELYLMLHRVAYHTGHGIHEILEEALAAHLKDHADAARPMPDKAEAKLQEKLFKARK